MDSDFILIVEDLIAIFDGSKLAAKNITQAARLAVGDIANSETLSQKIETFCGNVDFVSFELEIGGEVEGWRKVLLNQWNCIAAQIRRGGVALN